MYDEVGGGGVVGACGAVSTRERELTNGGRFEVQSRGEHGPIGFTRLDLPSHQSKATFPFSIFSHPYLPYLRHCTRPLSHDTIGGEKRKRCSGLASVPFLPP